MALPRYPAQPGYVYSGGFYPVQLPPQYPPQYPPNYYYHPYNVVGYAAAAPVPPSPRVIPRRPASPRRVIDLHPVLTSSRNRMIYWSITDEPQSARSNPHSDGPEFIHSSILAQPATSLEINKMLLASDDFPWKISIQVSSSEFITVGHVLGAIYGSLQESLTHDEWDELSRNSKTNAHRSRCVRLARTPARYAMPQEALAVRRIDALAEKTVFLGIKRVGDPENPSEWNVRIGFAAERDPRRR